MHAKFNNFKHFREKELLAKQLNLAMYIGKHIVS